MKLTIPLGKLKIVLHLIDVDPSDGDIDLGFGILWGTHGLNFTFNISWQ